MTQEKKQALESIEKSSSILITTCEHADYDEVAAALAWLYFLRTKNKTAELVIDSDNLQRFDWLPESKSIRLCEHQPQIFTIRVKTDKTKLGELSYELKDDYLEIYLTSKDGKFSPQDIEHRESKAQFDLIITLGAPDLASLGQVTDHYRQTLFERPIINIDRRSTNTSFGQVNIIELTATSLAEVCYDIFQSKLDKTLAHYLLTGMIAATNSFQTPQVTPQTLQIASDLIVAGAPREEIVLCLYRNKDINTLRAWGVVLSHLEQSGSIIYSSIKREELKETELNWQDLAEELILTSPGAHLAVLFYQREFTVTEAHIVAREHYNLPQLLQSLNPSGSKQHVTITLNKSLAEAQAETIALLQDKLKLING